jgi:hypothetical protein
MVSCTILAALSLAAALAAGEVLPVESMALEVAHRSSLCCGRRKQAA